MTTTTLDTLISRHSSLMALSKHLLGPEWTRGRYQTLAAQVAAGELSGWVAATVAAHAELEELRANVARYESEPGWLWGKIAELEATVADRDNQIEELKRRPEIETGKVKVLLEQLVKEKERELLTLKEAAAVTGLSQSALYARARRGRVPFQRNGSGIYFRRADLVEVIK